MKIIECIAESLEFPLDDRRELTLVTNNKRLCEELCKVYPQKEFDERNDTLKFLRLEDVKQAIEKCANTELFFLPKGLIDAHRQNLLNSQKMVKAFAELKKELGIK